MNKKIGTIGTLALIGYMALTGCQKNQEQVKSYQGAQKQITEEQKPQYSAKEQATIDSLTQIGIKECERKMRDQRVAMAMNKVSDNIFETKYSADMRIDYNQLEKLANGKEKESPWARSLVNYIKSKGFEKPGILTVGNMMYLTDGEKEKRTNVSEYDMNALRKVYKNMPKSEKKKQYFVIKSTL